jgi:hypothetical protein
VSQRL